MSEYLRNLDKEKERINTENRKYQQAITNSGSGRSGPIDKKKSIRTCIGFIIVLIIAIVVVVAISL